jgi:hypothetical protein
MLPRSQLALRLVGTYSTEYHSPFRKGIRTYFVEMSDLQTQ